MKNGIYHVIFAAQNRHGEGLAVFENGKINGGDPIYLYLGHYNVDGDKLNATMKIKRWNHSGNSVFGNITEFNLKLTCPYKQGSDTFNASGNIVNQPALKINISGTRKSDLAAANDF